MTIDYATAGRPPEAYGQAWADFDGDAWVALFTEDAEYHEDPFEPPLVGHNALRRYLLEAAEDAGAGRVHDRAALGLGSRRSSPRCTPVSSAGRRGPGSASPGFMTLDIAPDGRVSRLPRMAAPARDPAAS